MAGARMRLLRRIAAGSLAAIVLGVVGAGGARAGSSLSLTGFSPQSGPVGTGVTLTGTGFSKADGVAFDGTTAAVLHVNKAGTKLTTQVPALAASGPITVTDPTTGVVASLPGSAFAVTRGIATFPAQIWPGQHFTFAGSGLSPDISETLYVDAAELGTARTDSHGNFAAGCTLPWTTSPGHHTFSVVDANLGTISKVLLVPSSWPMDGAVPARTYANTLENALAASQLPQVSKKFRTGFAPSINTAPVVAGGLVYTGHQDTLTAEDAVTGALVWSFTASDTIASTPVVDSGVIYVTSYDTNLYALGATDGHFIWRVPLGTSESSPLVSKGVVYFGTDSGFVYALGAADGHFVWDYSTGGAVLSPPSVAKGIVYFGSQDGYVYAVKAGTGMLVWRYQTGTAEQAVSVSAGVAVVAAGGYVQAFNASSGAPEWTAGSGYFGGLWAAVAGGVVYMSSHHDAAVTALKLSDGSTLWSYPCSNPGTPTYADGVLYVTCGASLLGFDTLQGGSPWTWTLPGASDSFSGSPVAIAGGRLYATSFAFGASSTDWLYCLGP